MNAKYQSDVVPRVMTQRPTREETPSPISAQLCALHEALNSIEMAISQLHVKLSPVMPIVPKAENESSQGTAAAMCPLARELAGLVEQAFTVAKLLHEVVDEIQL